jgi:hypothetical protein
MPPARGGILEPAYARVQECLDAKHKFVKRITRQLGPDWQFWLSG